MTWIEISSEVGFRVQGVKNSDYNTTELVS